MAGRVAIVCAMEAEIKPLARGWKKVRDRGLTFLESDDAVAVAGGIGSAPAALAAMTLVAREHPAACFRRDLRERCAATYMWEMFCGRVR